MDNDRNLRLGYSPCPNDTFIFHALASASLGKKCDLFSEITLQDVETLNAWAFEGLLDVTKISFHALGHVLDRYVLLRSGSALGRGCGPLIVSAGKLTSADLSGKRIAIPGRYTTAAFLMQLFSPQSRDLVPMRFDLIMPAVARGEFDAGVIIHESRFTYHTHGLNLVQDLGEWWESKTGLPIPLGGIAACRSLGSETIDRVDRCIAESVKQAFGAPDSGMGYIRSHARELEEKVIRDHIDLYVNDFTRDLGEEGAAAVAAFFELGREKGIFPDCGLPTIRG